MFTKCNYIFETIYGLDIPDRDKLKLCLEINSLVNLIMYGKESRPYATINDIQKIHKITKDFYKQGKRNVA